MTSLVRPRRDMRVLEVGTGSGYQTAVLAECVREVDTIEIVPGLGRRAEAPLREPGDRNVRVRVGDGYAGWPERAPYGAIVLTAAPEQVPRPLLDRLRVGGRLVAPVGRGVQELVVITRSDRGPEREAVGMVRSVPMTGRAEARPRGREAAMVPEGRRRLMGDVEGFCREVRPIEDRCDLERRSNDRPLPLARQYDCKRLSKSRAWRSRTRHEACCAGRRARPGPHSRRANASAGKARSIISRRKSSRPRSGSRASSVR
jgi:hypothetical protein